MMPEEEGPALIAEPMAVDEGETTATSSTVGSSPVLL